MCGGSASGELGMGDPKAAATLPRGMNWLLKLVPADLRRPLEPVPVCPGQAVRLPAPTEPRNGKQSMGLGPRGQTALCELPRAAQAWVLAGHRDAVQARELGPNQRIVRCESGAAVQARGRLASARLERAKSQDPIEGLGPAAALVQDRTAPLPCRRPGLADLGQL